jgi:hypothetical protein
MVGPDSSTRAEVRAAARRAEANPVFEALARAGFVADGVVHALVGIIAIVVGLGGDGETDQSGALLAVAGAPLGFVALWLAAITLAALALWQVLEGLLVPRPSRRRKWTARLGEWSRGAVFLALAVVAASVAVGAHPNPDESVQDASRGLLYVPGGPFVLGAIGLVIGGIGVAFVVRGVFRRFTADIRVPAGHAGDAVLAVGVVGYAAKGLALVTVGVLLVIAAVKVEPDDAGGLDAALDGLVTLPLGPALCTAIGVGLIAYGVYLGLSARFRRI